MDSLDQIFHSASMLSEDDRLRLIDLLRETIPEYDPSSLSPEWREELARRAEALDRGEEKTSPWSEVKARMEKRISKHE